MAKNIAASICLIDGAYTNKQIIECIIKQKAFKGFIGRFSKVRNIKTDSFKGKLKAYIKTLDLKKDFNYHQICDKDKLIHKIKISLDYGPQFNLIVLLDDIKDIKSARPLLTNMLDLSAKTVAEYYSLRWKEETYHQVIKDAFFARTHKFRKLKTLSRYLEVINICYGLCEQRRWANYGGNKTIFEIKNELLVISKEEFILNLKGRKTCKSRREAILSKYRSQI